MTAGAARAAGAARIAQADELAALDFTDPALHARRDLSRVWDHLRRDQPVYWHLPPSGGEGFWLVTSHAEVTTAYRDDVHLSSERGNVLDAIREGGDSAAGQMISVTDGSRHGDIRKILTRTFSARGLESTRHRVGRAVRELIAGAVDRGTCDFARDVAAQIPLVAICDLLGVPAADRQHILALTSSTVASEQPDSTAADAWRAKNEILFYFAGLAADRTASPRDDIVTLLTKARIRNRQLTDDEVIFNCYSLVLGGDETTRLAIVGAILALIDNPGQWRALKNGEAGIETAVEEILRWTTPSMHQARVATGEIRLAEKVISPGDTVTLWNNSANRDHRVFASPDIFDLGRHPNKHLTFGAGRHFCLGSQLARLEIAAVLESLREMVTHMELAAPPARLYSNFLGGFSSLAVTVK